MVTTFGIAVFIFFFPWSLWFGYRTATDATLYRSLKRADPDNSGGLVDGETVAIEGDVIVDEPAATGDRAIDEADSAVAAYIWHAQFPRAGKYEVDLKSRETSQKKSTFASGIESGRFTVTDGRRRIRVDPEWLVETHEATDLSELTVGGISRSKSFHTYLWDSPYVYLTGDATEVSLNRMRSVVTKHNSSIDLDDYYLESKPILEGDSLAIRGEIRIDQGEPVVHGTDETPLLISDQGFDGVSDDLRSRTVKHGGISVAFFAVAVFALLL